MQRHIGVLVLLFFLYLSSMPLFASARAVRSTHQQSKAVSCNESFTMADSTVCRPCTPCPLRYGVKEECNSQNDTVCVKCPPGTFSDTVNLTAKCIPCTWPTCIRPDRLRSCNGYSDSSCDICGGGFFDNKRRMKCSPCTNCAENGMVEVFPCTYENDTICQLPPSTPTPSLGHSPTAKQSESPTPGSQQINSSPTTTESPTVTRKTADMASKTQELTTPMGAGTTKVHTIILSSSSHPSTTQKHSESDNTDVGKFVGIGIGVPAFLAIVLVIRIVLVKILCPNKRWFPGCCKDCGATTPTQDTQPPETTNRNIHMDSHGPARSLIQELRKQKDR